MKIRLEAKPPATPRSRRGKSRPSRQRGHGDAGTAPRPPDKVGGYKRIEIYLGVEASIALRQLMRDGRTAREVVEALLLAEKQRRKTQAAPYGGS